MMRLEEILEKVENDEPFETDEETRKASEEAVERTIDLSKPERFRRWVRKAADWIVDPFDDSEA